MSDYQAGTAYLSILPSTRGFQQRLRREMAAIDQDFAVQVAPQLNRREMAQLQAALRALPTVVLDADAAPADRAIAELRARLERLSDQTIGIDISGEQARAEIDAIRGELDRLGRESPDIAVRVDTGAASAALANVNREVSRVDGRVARVVVNLDAGRALAQIASTAYAINQFANKTYKFHVEADTAGAVLSVAALAAKISALGGLIGVVGGVGGALGGLGAAGVVAAGGLGATVLASLGVGKALSAMNAQQDAAMTTARQSAKQQQQQANAIISAQDRVTQASKSASQARVEGARSVADAEKSAARQNAQALAQVASANRSYKQAVADLEREQSTLNKAWEDGRRSLEDLQSQLEGNRLDQRQAALDLKDAEKDLAAARQSGNLDAIERATIAYDRQKKAVDDLARDGKRLAADNAEAQAKGVAGSDQVVAANERIAQATQRRDDAERAAQQASADATQTRLDGEESVARAREQVQQRVEAADQQVIEANRALQQALAQTGDAGVSAAEKVETALASLSPAAAAFARYLFGLKPVLDGLSATAATAFFPPLMSGLDALLTKTPLVNTVVGQLAGAMGLGLQQVLTTLANPFWSGFFALLGNAAGTLIPGLFAAIMNLAQAAAILIQYLLPLAPAGFDFLNQVSALVVALAPFIAQLLGGLIPAASAFLEALRPLGPVLGALQPILLVLGQAFSAVLGAVLQALAPILVALTPLIQALATQLATNLVSSIETLTPLLVAVATWLGQNPGLVLGVISVIGGLMGALKPLAFVLGIVVSALHNFLIIKVAQAALAAFGLQGSVFGQLLIRLLSPINLLKMVLPMVGRAVMMLGRSVLAAMGPLGWILTIFGLLYSSNEQFRNAINGLIGTIMGLVGQLLSALMPAVNMLLGALIPVVNTIIGALVPVFNVLIGVILQVIQAVLPPLIGIIQSAVIPIIVTLAGIFVSVLVWVLQNVVVPVLNALVWVLTNIVIPVILWLANNIIVPAFTLIGQIITFVVNNLVMPVFNAIVWVLQNILGPAFTWLWRNIVEPAFRGLGQIIEWVWLNVIKPAWDAVMGGLTWLQDGFRSAVDWIGQKWNELRGLLAKPINFLIDVVWNKGILVAWNKVAEFLPGIEPIAPLGLIPEYASGGLLRGPGTGTSDDILAVNSSGAPTARVSNGEYVVNAAVTKKTLPFLEALNGGNGEALQAAGGLNRVSRTYRGPSFIRNYAAGGLFQERIDAAKDWLDDAEGMPYVWGGTVTPNMAGTDCSGMQAAVTHILSGRSPYSGRIGTTATMPWGGFVRGLNSAYAIGNKPSDHMAGTLDGDNVEQHGPNGTPFAFPSRWGADASYFNQQWSLPIVGGQFASGGNGNDGWMTGKVKGIFDDVTNPLIDAIRNLMGAPPPQWRAVPPALATRSRDSIRDWLFGKAADYENANGPMDVSGISGPVVDQVRQVAAMYGWDQGPEWTALAQLINKESSWNPNAANPASSARGLFQKMTSLHGPVEATAAGQAAWGLDYIKGKFGTPSAAWAYHQQHNSYDRGGLARGKGFLFKDVIRPERVLDPQETQAYPTLTRLSQQLEAGRLTASEAPRVPAQQISDMTSAAGQGPMELSGELYLDGREFLGKVRGVVTSEIDASKRELIYGRKG